MTRSYYQCSSTYYDQIVLIVYVAPHYYCHIILIMNAEPHYYDQVILIV